MYFSTCLKLHLEKDNRWLCLKYWQMSQYLTKAIQTCVSLPLPSPPTLSSCEWLWISCLSSCCLGVCPVDGSVTAMKLNTALEPQIALGYHWWLVGTKTCLHTNKSASMQQNNPETTEIRCFTMAKWHRLWDRWFKKKPYLPAGWWRAILKPYKAIHWSNKTPCKPVHEPSKILSDKTSQQPKHGVGSGKHWIV